MLKQNISTAIHIKQYRPSQNSQEQSVEVNKSLILLKFLSFYCNFSISILLWKWSLEGEIDIIVILDINKVVSLTHTAFYTAFYLPNTFKTVITLFIMNSLYNLYCITVCRAFRIFSITSWYLLLQQTWHLLENLHERLIKVTPWYGVTLISWAKLNHGLWSTQPKFITTLSI